PFGRREMVGVIVGVKNTSAFPIEKLKTINALLDETALINPDLLVLYEWASQYYQHAIGNVIVGSLPKKVREGAQII
ncbi:hypothetical protein, partial [Staphylococcus aureus]|uniref:primosomal protein N' family DNA-binding protein n=1 Tax=Staphylococcus aureus TaxID=1280 RepID=UPI0021B13531